MRKLIAAGCLVILLSLAPHLLAAPSTQPDMRPDQYPHWVESDHPGRLPADPENPYPVYPSVPVPLYGFTSLPNPAIGRLIPGTPDDPLGMFVRRPLDTFIIPAGGTFLDPLHDGPHYGVDYANPADYLDGRQTRFHPIAPGYVTARSWCHMCFVDGDRFGRVGWKWSQYNFGWGGLVLVETPYTSNISIYVLYAHLDHDYVSLGDYVSPEDVIGVVGATGYAEEIHLHMEVRFGPPGSFWNADFGRRETLDRWMATMFVNPAFAVFPENHPGFAERIDEWLAHQSAPRDIP